MLNFYKCFEHWSKPGSTTWLISDTHFGDPEPKMKNLRRPSDEILLANINSKVGKKDVLIHLGDVGDIEFARKMKGYKILICGNHDAGRTNYEEVFNEIYEGPLIVAEKIILSHEPLEVPWAFNFHGHDHFGTPRRNHYNTCVDVMGYYPLNLNQFMKQGPASKVVSVHRFTIDKAAQRKIIRSKKSF